MKKQNIEDIFSSMEDFSSVPPAELWGQIEEKLDKPKKKKRALLWWSAAACLLLGLGLPSVLHFNSDSGVKINTNALENNSLVLDNENTKANTNPKVPSEKNNIEQLNDNDSSNKTVISNSDTQNKNQNSNLNSTPTSGKDQNQETQIAVSVSGNNIKRAKLNSKSESDKIIKNQKAVESSFAVNGENSFTPASKNKTFNNRKETVQQIATQNSYNSGKSNAFNASENKLQAAEKRNADKILATKTFSAGKQNGFNSVSKNQVPNSVFNDSYNSNKSKNNNSNVAFNSPSNPILSGSQNGSKENKPNLENPFSAEMNIAAIQKNNSKTVNSSNKIDSVQLAELQNLEKGIAAVETKKETEKKSVSKAAKWAVEVFAGVANSENTRNDKTLGNVNDSKQSNSYGVKTKYKINKKWAVGSGFKINELGQSVANVSYISAKNNAFFSPSDYFIQNSTVPQIASDASYVLVSNNTKNSLNSDNIESGNLDQNLRYFEMPLEVSYSVFNRNKTNISLNTGGFVGKLISNNVALDGTPIGQNLNANDFVYGSTLSSTLQYRIYKKTSIFAEPAINYYINPLSNQSFNQFQWGLNFGLNVSF